MRPTARVHGGSLSTSLPLLAGRGLAVLAPAADWSQPVLLAALAAVSAIAYAAEARLKAANRVFFGANLIVALVALAVAGPVAAFLVWLVPDLSTRFVLGTEQRLSPGFVANVGSYALAVLAGAGLLALAGSPDGHRDGARLCTRRGSRCGRSTSASPGSPSLPSTSATARRP